MDASALTELLAPLGLSPAQAAGAAVLLILFVAASLWRGARHRASLAEQAEINGERMAAILRAQAELGGRLAASAETLGARQAELSRSLGARLDAMTGRVSQTFSEQARATHVSLARLGERLAAIDTAQANIQTLASQVVGLQAVLSDKQARGAFGQGRMEAIVADALPPGAFAFQATLSNGSRPDCLIHMPNGQPALAVDAKFPLEAWSAIRAAETAEAKRLAVQNFRRDVETHLRDIAGKYLIPGETQDTAFLFVPSESVFAEIHESFEPLVQRAHRSRVVIVGPSLLMLAIQVVQGILRDARMREQAHLIQNEVARLSEDLGRLDERVRRLGSHFGQAVKDVDEILVSTGRLQKRGARIEAMELAAPEPDEAVPASKEPDGRAGQLRLRIVEE